MSTLLALLCPCLGPRSSQRSSSTRHGEDSDERAPLLGSASQAGSSSNVRSGTEERGYRRIERLEINHDALSNVRLQAERNLFHIDSSTLPQVAPPSTSPTRTSSLGPLGRRTRRSASANVKSVQLGWEPRMSSAAEQRRRQASATTTTTTDQESEGEQQDQADRRGRSTLAKLPLHSATARLQESSKVASRVPSEHSLRTLYDQGAAPGSENEAETFRKRLRQAQARSGPLVEGWEDQDASQAGDDHSTDGSVVDA